MDLFTYAETIVQTDEARLVELETTIEHGLQTFVDVGTALLEIRDSKLYRKGHETFEDYCRTRWNMSRIHAHRMIEAAEVNQNLLPTGNILPNSERQARELTQLEPEQINHTECKLVPIASVWEHVSGCKKFEINYSTLP
jgi:hypothetical protein